MSSTPAQPKRRYRTTNWKQYNAALKARGSLTVWFDKNMAWFAAASGKRGRSPKFSDAAIEFCLTIKNLLVHAGDWGARYGKSGVVTTGRRSLVKTKMHCMKRLGESVMSRTFER